MTAILVAEKNRLSRAIPEVRPRIQAHIAWLEQELNDLDSDLRESILNSPVWRDKDELLRSVPGCLTSAAGDSPAGRGRHRNQPYRSVPPSSPAYSS